VTTPEDGTPAAEPTPDPAPEAAATPPSEPEAEPIPGIDFDPYRFGAPEHPIPPEYAPPGYTPPPVQQPPNPWAPSESSSVTPPPYAGGYPTTPLPPIAPPPPYAGQQYPTYPQQPGYPPPGYPPPGYAQQPGYPPPTYQYPAGYAYPQPTSGPGAKAITALCCGVGSVVFFWTSLFDIVLIVLALVFGLLAMRDARKRPGRPGHALAVTGVITGLAGLVLATIFSVWVVTQINNCGGFNNNTTSSEFSNCFNNNN
jgi:hypothetical protein